MLFLKAKKKLNTTQLLLFSGASEFGIQLSNRFEIYNCSYYTGGGAAFLYSLLFVKNIQTPKIQKGSVLTQNVL